MITLISEHVQLLNYILRLVNRFFDGILMVYIPWKLLPLENVSCLLLFQFLSITCCDLDLNLNFSYQVMWNVSIFPYITRIWGSLRMCVYHLLEMRPFLSRNSEGRYALCLIFLEYMNLKRIFDYCLHYKYLNFLILLR